MLNLLNQLKTKKFQNNDEDSFKYEITNVMNKN